MRMTRRHFVAGAAAGALVAAGGYELVDRLTAAPSRRRATALPPEQHLLESVQVDQGQRRRGARAAAPPPGRHGEVRASSAAELRKARADLERRSPSSTGATTRRRPGSASPSPGGSRTSAATSPSSAETPSADRPARVRGEEARSCGRCSTPSASRATRRTTILEANDVAVLLRERPARPHRRRREDALRGPRRLPADEHPPGLRRRRLRRRARAAEADGAGGRRPGRRPDPATAPSSSSASPRPRRRVSGRARIANLETLGYSDGGAGRLLPPRHAHAPLPHDRGPRGVVHQLRLRRAGRDRVPARPATSATERRRSPSGPKDVGTTRRGAARVPARRGDRAQPADPDDVAPAARRCAARTARVYPKGTAVPQRADFNTLDNPFFWTADPDVDQHERPAGRRAALRRLQPDERRLPPQPPGDGRRAAGRHEAAVRPRGPRRRASTPCSRRRTARTSSCRRGAHRSFPLAELLA